MDKIVAVSPDGDHVFVEIGEADGMETYQFHLTPDKADELADRLRASARRLRERE